MRPTSLFQSTYPGVVARGHSPHPKGASGLVHELWDAIRKALFMEEKQLITITIPGPPMAWQRRVATKTGHSFTPKKTRAYEALVSFTAQSQGVSPLRGPVSLSLEFFLPRPKRLMRKKDPEGPVSCAVKPDIDNLTKAIIDGLNGVAYADDRQVVHVTARKHYHEKQGEPRVEVTISNDDHE